MTNLTRLVACLLYPTPPPSPPPTRKKATPGLYLGWGHRGPVTAGPEEHVLVLGPPRSGKTSRLVVPALIRHPGPAVVTSTKSDVLKATVGHRSRLGRCWYWDPSGTTVVPAGVEPLAWSPVVDCEVWDRAVARAHALATAARPNPSAHDAHWVERAEALLAPLLHATALGHGDLAVLLSWLHRRELTEPVAVLDDHNARRAKDLLQGLAHTDTRELSGIFSTADSILAAYRTDAALTATRVPNFDADLFASSSDTVYLSSPAATQAVHAALVVALLDQIRSATYRWRPNPSMLFALDEVANIAPLPDLPATVAEGGSQGLVVLACLQDLSQARTRWDKAADGFFTLFTQKVILPGIADMATLKAISALAGDVDVNIRSISKDHRGLFPTSSTTTSVRRQPRLPFDRIAVLPVGTGLLVTAGHLARVRV